MPVYKNEKNNTWYVSIRYTDYTGKHSRKLKRGFKYRKDAVEYEHNFKVSLAGSPEMTFAALANIFLEDKKANNKEISYKTRKSRFENWILPTFKDKPINEITAADIRHWQNKLKGLKKANGESYSPAYLNNIVTELAECFHYAVRFYGLPTNPVQIAGNTAGHKVKSLNFWTKTEFDSFISTFDLHDPYYTVFMLLYYTGMREGELLALTAADFDQEENSIRVNKTYHMIDGRDVVTSPKTKKANRTIILPPFVASVLTDYLSMVYKPEPDNRIFPYPDTTILRKLKEHCEAANVKKIRVHDLRHSHASLLIELGFSALLVAERLGHENVTTTMDIYAHLFPSKQSEVADKLERLYSDTALIPRNSADSATDADSCN